jgi:hypothetical protein
LVPQSSTASMKSGALSLTLAPYSLTVYRIPGL